MTIDRNWTQTFSNVVALANRLDALRIAEQEFRKELHQAVVATPLEGTMQVQRDWNLAEQIDQDISQNLATLAYHLETLRLHAMAERDAK